MVDPSNFELGGHTPVQKGAAFLQRKTTATVERQVFLLVLYAVLCSDLKVSVM
jgi:hypothetical protein